GEKYPVLYALHGAHGNEWDWFNRLDAKNCADRLIRQNKIKPLIIVCTETLNNFILTSDISDKEKANKDLFGEYICKELVPYIDSHYATIKSNESRYIGGVSMGGFIAIQTALHNPKLFGKAGGHSPASWIYDFSDSSFDSWLYSAETVNDSGDPVEFAQKKGLSDIKVFLDCGKDDYGFVDDTGKIHDALIKRGINSTCTIGEGGHSTDYWAANLEKYFEFYNK
ncbi:MAG: esterase family protein, partial [Clostridiaceae bacterium]|nr:esterase family protein [Clostridiaceae bacterium]